MIFLLKELLLDVQVAETVLPAWFASIAVEGPDFHLHFVQNGSGDPGVANIFSRAWSEQVRVCSLFESLDIDSYSVGASKEIQRLHEDYRSPFSGFRDLGNLQSFRSQPYSSIQPPLVRSSDSRANLLDLYDIADTATRVYSIYISVEVCPTLIERRDSFNFNL